MYDESFISFLFSKITILLNSFRLPFVMEDMSKKVTLVNDLETLREEFREKNKGSIGMTYFQGSVMGAVLQIKDFIEEIKASPPYL